MAAPRIPSREQENISHQTRKPENHHLQVSAGWEKDISQLVPRSMWFTYWTSHGVLFTLLVFKFAVSDTQRGVLVKWLDMTCELKMGSPKKSNSWLVVFPTHLKNIRKSNWILPNFWGENKKYLRNHLVTWFKPVVSWLSQFQVMADVWSSIFCCINHLILGESLFSPVVFFLKKRCRVAPKKGCEWQENLGKLL